MWCWTTKLNRPFYRSIILRVLQLIHLSISISSSTTSKMHSPSWISMKKIELRSSECKKKHASKELSLGKKSDWHPSREKQKKLKPLPRSWDSRKKILANFKGFIRLKTKWIHIMHSLLTLMIFISCKWEAKKSKKKLKWNKWSHLSSLDQGSLCFQPLLTSWIESQ